VFGKSVPASACSLGLSMEATHERLDLSHRSDRRGHGHPFVLRPALIAHPTGKDELMAPKDMAPKDMAPKETRVEPLSEGTTIYVQWGPIIAGAIAAAALALVLHGFAIAIGLSVSSTAPTWRDASLALVLLSGLYLLLAAIAAYGFGGYVAGRVRSRLTTGTPDDIEFRDGAHGLLVWALATLLAGLMAFATAQSITRLAAPSTGAAGPSSSAGGENIIAYDLDRLFRGERRAEGDLSYARAEAGRILLTASSHRGMAADDRAYLVRLVTTRSGLAPADAERRVDEVIARAKENIDRARRSGVILAFMAGAAALLGAAAAWFAACAGGEHRDGRVAPHPLWDWGRPVRRV
jgi:hypothetical protein